MLRNAARKSACTAFAVVVSGYVGVTTVPLMTGGEPPQRPKPPTLSTPTALQVAVGFRTTLPLMRVIGTVRVLVTPSVAAIA